MEHYIIPPWGTSDISTHCVGCIQYRAEPKHVKAGVVVGEILTSQKLGFHPNLAQILIEFSENPQKKMRIYAHFHPLLLFEY